MTISKEGRLQRRIDHLLKENERLKTENVTLKSQIENSKETLDAQSREYEVMTSVIQKCKERYESAIDSARNAEKKYKDALREIKSLKGQYEKELKAYTKSLNKN